MSAVSPVSDEPYVFALDVGCCSRNSKKLPYRVGHMHHWGASLHKSESPESGLVDCLIAESIALGLIPLDSSLPVEFAAYDHVLLPIFDCPEVRSNGPPRSLCVGSVLFCFVSALRQRRCRGRPPPTPVTPVMLLCMSELSFWLTSLGISPCTPRGFGSPCCNCPGCLLSPPWFAPVLVARRFVIPRADILLT